MKGIYPMKELTFIPEDMKDKSLEEAEKNVVMPWGIPFSGDEFVETANSAAKISETNAYDFIPLWSEEQDRFEPEFNNDRSSVCFMTKKTDDNVEKPAVIICPGGGYELLSAKSEGLDVLKKMEEAGYRAFVLFYRVNPERYPEPQKDLAMAMKYLRTHDKEYGILPDQIMILGFSAGGHLCASFAAYHKEYEKEIMKDLDNTAPILAEKYRGVGIRPDMVCLCYPVVSFMEEGHEGSFQALTGGREEVREKLSVERHVDSSYPKTFIWACKDDKLVPVSNAEHMGEVLTKTGVQNKMEIFPTGGHGCSLAVGTSAESWMADMLDFMKRS